MVQNQTETPQPIIPDGKLDHHLRNGFQSIIPKLFDKPEILTTSRIHTAIQKFLERVKNDGLGTVPSETKEQLFSEFTQLLDIEDLSILIESLKKLYCQYDPDTCQRMSNPNPQQSLI